jgi:cold shock protein
MSERRQSFFREETPLGRRVEAKVKWFNGSKGFGFVTLADGSQDAFLPMAVLRRAGYEDVREGASITCEIGAGVKGPLVTNVLNVDDSTALSSPSGAGAVDRGPRPATTIDGAVKWFEPEKGYGFISPDGGG